MMYSVARSGRSNDKEYIMGAGNEVLGKLSIEGLLSKAALADTIDTSEVANSILSRQQADRFIDLVVDTSKLLKNIRVARIDFPSGEINKMDIGDIVSESTDAVGTSTFKPTASKVDYDTSKVRSCFDITSDFLEDNLEGESVRDKLLNMFTKRIAIDLEMLALEGNSTITQNASTSRKNRLMGANDGFQRILETGISNNGPVPAAQLLDAEGANVSAALYYAMKSAVPARYRVAGPDYRWICSSRAWDKWNYDLTQLGAEAASDVTAKFREMGGGGKPFGIQQVEIPLFPTDLEYTVGGSTYNDGSSIWLTPLLNLIYFIQRSITIEWDRVPRSDKWEVTIHTRCDFSVENTDMCVVAQNVGVNGADYTA